MEKGIISSCELINCVKTDIQVLLILSNIYKIKGNELIPTISINGCDSANIYLNHKSNTSDIVTSRSSSINVTLTHEDGTCDEYPISEVFVSNFSGKKLITKPVVHG